MEHEERLIVTRWTELTGEEKRQMDEAKAREWQNEPMGEDEHRDNIVFLLKDGDTLLAQGQLVPVDGVQFNGETFDILGIGGIISEVKRKGYGRKLMSAIRKYLLEHDTSAVGFIGLPEFYQKCGFHVSREAIKRFVYMHDGKRIVNTESDHVCYFDGSDQFMKKVIANPHTDVLLPRGPDW